MEWNYEELNALTEKIIGCVFTVSNKLGAGFLEKVYENALAYELRKQGLTVAQQESIKVLYENVVVGTYAADLIVANKVLLELKTVDRIDDTHVSQCLNYLKATRMKVCLLINFGTPKAEIRRLLNGAV